MVSGNEAVGANQVIGNFDAVFQVVRPGVARIDEVNEPGDVAARQQYFPPWVLFRLKALAGQFHVSLRHRSKRVQQAEEF